LAKPDPKSLRKKTGRKPGGQHGHPGSTLAMVDSPTRTLVHEPAACRGCGDPLLLAAVTSVERSAGRGPAGGRAGRGRAPARRAGVRLLRHADEGRGAGRGGRRGAVRPRVEARALYLHAGQFLAKDRAADALRELFGVALSPGTVMAMVARAAARLAGEFLGQVRDLLTDAPVLGVDETGLRVAGKLHWVHRARTEKLTLVVVHPRRGRAGIDFLGVLPRGVVVHDC
jgi:hypothetical protein